MLNSIAAAVHWSGFVISINVLIILITVYAKTDVWAGDATDKGILMLIAPPVLGWATRFILTGHKSPLPWVENKQTEQ